MFRTVRIPIATPPGRKPGGWMLSAALFAVGAALAPAPAIADQNYPPGLFENSPVVPNGQPTGQPAPGAPSGPDGAAADAAPPPADNAYGGPSGDGAPVGPQGYGGPAGPQGYGAPSGPYGSAPPPAPYAPAPPAGPYAPSPYRPEADIPLADYCAGIATRVFRSIEEVRRAHARCDRAYYAPPPAGYPPAY